MQPKWFLRSKTLIGALIAIAPALLPMFGVSWSADDSQMVTQEIDLVISGLGGSIVALDRIFSSHKPLKALPTFPHLKRR